MLPFLPARADIGKFDCARPAMLTGEALTELDNIEASILRFGLLSPIVVSQVPGSDRFQIVDGRKRVLALSRLAFKGKLPRSLSSIPYVVADMGETSRDPLSLLSQLEQYEQVQALVVRGLSDAAIAQVLYASPERVRGIRSVESLSPKLKNAFFGGHIDLAQARAFATLPNPDSQDELLIALGPFAQAPDILDAIAAGETVVRVGAGEDDILILPSREAA